MTPIRIALFIFLSFWFPGKAAFASAGTVYTVNYPLYYFAKAIAGNELDIVFPVPKDIDPAYWKPSTENILALQSADLILLNGAGYASWVSNTTLPRSRIVDTGKSFRNRLIPAEAHAAHSHGPEGAHAHSGKFAFTTWLDISLARAQAQAIERAFTRKWPNQKEAFKKRYNNLDTQLANLEAEMAEFFAPLSNKPLFASHPVYQYLERAQGLDLTSFHWEPNVMPSSQDWTDFDNELATKPAKVMIWEAAPHRGISDQLDQRGIKIVILPPLFQAPDEGDFLSVLLNAVTNDSLSE